MMRRILLLLCATFLLPVRIAAQSQPPERLTAVAVFLDCQANGCDTEHFRNEIEFVNWVRDRTVADVHLLITSQGSGAGGTAYTLAYIGQRSFAGDSVTLTLDAAQGLTDGERRDLLTHRIAQGLLRYAARTALADRLRVEYDTPREQRAAETLAADPWNLWVFSTRVDFSTEGESRELNRQLELSFDAGRVSRAWKLEFEVEAGYDEDRRELTTRTVTAIRRDYNAGALIAKALAPLWSGGVSLEAGRSTFRNQDLYVRAATVAEYSFFPYDQFSRRQLTLQYSVGTRYFRYNEPTIYDQLRENRYDHRLELSADFRQPWGSAGASVTGSHYLHDTKRSNLSFDAGIDIRLFRGLSLDVSGSYARVHDQLYIPKGDADDDEVLLRRRALETDYRYETSVGIRYTFGSIYNNIVNPRLGGVN